MSNTTSSSRDQEDSHMRGGTRAQHAAAGRQSHKNQEQEDRGVNSRSRTSAGSKSSSSSSRR